MPGFVIETVIRSTAGNLPERVLCMDGVNAELRPLVRMTAPSEWRSRNLREWPPGLPLFTSLILLFGVLPVDLHRFRLESVTASAFEENSSSLLNRSWRHCRTITRVDDGYLVRDRVEFTSRLPGLGHILAPVYRAVFAHRHRRLRRLFDGAG